MSIRIALDFEIWLALHSRIALFNFVTHTHGLILSAEGIKLVCRFIHPSRLKKIMTGQKVILVGQKLGILYPSEHNAHLHSPHKSDFRFLLHVKTV